MAHTARLIAEAALMREGVARRTLSRATFPLPRRAYARRHMRSRLGATWTFRHMTNTMTHRHLADEIRELAHETQRRDPRAQLRAARGAGRGRLRRRLAGPVARGGEDRAEVIVFCGVHFMAETAAILSPEKTVLLPDLAAGCSLAATSTPQQLRAWKAEHPGAVVVSYVNTTAEVKAERDYCCTSGNAVEIVNAIPADKEILFLPDMFLGAHVRRVTGRREHAHLDGRVPRARGDRSGSIRSRARGASRRGAPRPPGVRMRDGGARGIVVR